MRQIKYRAFTMAELMVLLTFLTVLLAAFAPILTTKKTTTIDDNKLWTFITGDKEYSAALNTPKQNNEFFVGITPTSDQNAANITPRATITIRSKMLTRTQGQMGFKYNGGKTRATLFANATNMLLGGPNRTSITATNSTSFGQGAMENGVNSSSVAIGYKAFNKPGTGTAIGAYAGEYGTTGGGNTLIGYKAGAANYKGTSVLKDNNTIIGVDSLSKSQSKDGSNVPYGNTVIGNNSLLRANMNNTVIGHNSLRRNKAHSNDRIHKYNTVLGTSAATYVAYSDALTTIGYNSCTYDKLYTHKTCIGANSGAGEVENIYTGTKSDVNYTGTIENKSYNKLLTNEDSYSRTFIGSKPSNSNGIAPLEIHNKSENNRKVVINGDLVVKGQTYLSYTSPANGNKVVGAMKFFSNTSTDKAYLHPADGAMVKDNPPNNIGYLQYNTCFNQNTYNYTPNTDMGRNCPNLFSDVRLKDLNGEYTEGLDKLTKIKVYNYTYKKDKENTPQVGIIAQDLKRIFPTAVSKDEKGYYKIRWDEILYAAINSVKELHQKVVNIAQKVATDKERIKNLKDENKQLQAKLNNLAQELTELEKK